MAAYIHSETPGAFQRPCNVCGSPLWTTHKRLDRGHGKFCSRECLFQFFRDSGHRPPGRTKPAKIKHGHNRNPKSRSPTYTAWHGMKQRCLNPKHINYARYGGRGISVCAAWLDFTAFLADMGERPDGLTLDRIDTDGNYEPGNCRWATMKEQCNNWSAAAQFLVSYGGEQYTLQMLADKLGINRYTLRQRILVQRWPEDKWHLPPGRQNRGVKRLDTPAHCKPAV